MFGNEIDFPITTIELQIFIGSKLDVIIDTLLIETNTIYRRTDLSCIGFLLKEESSSSIGLEQSTDCGVQKC